MGRKYKLLTIFDFESEAKLQLFQKELHDEPE